MYREYEDPFRLEEALKDALKRLEEATDEDEIMSLHEEVDDLRERENFAWQDADE